MGVKGRVQIKGWRGSHPGGETINFLRRPPFTNRPARRFRLECLEGGGVQFYVADRKYNLQIANDTFIHSNLEIKFCFPRCHVTNGVS